MIGTSMLLRTFTNLYSIEGVRYFSQCKIHSPFTRRDRDTNKTKGTHPQITSLRAANAYVWQSEQDWHQNLGEEIFIGPDSENEQTGEPLRTWTDTPDISTSSPRKLELINQSQEKWRLGLSLARSKPDLPRVVFPNGGLSRWAPVTILWPLHWWFGTWF